MPVMFVPAKVSNQIAWQLAWATGSLQHKVKADQAPALLVTVKQTTDKFIPWGQHSPKQEEMKEASSNHALTSTLVRPGNIKKNIQ